MKVNLEEYTKNLQHFIFTMQENIYLEEDKLFESLDPICKTLRVAKISLKKNPAKNNTILHGVLDQILYETEDAEFNKDEFLEFTERTEDIVELFFKFYKIADNEPWSQDEENYIQTLQKLIYAYTGWFQLITYTSFSQGYDPRFSIHNLNYGIGQIDNLLQIGEIKNYGVACFNLHNFSYINKIYGETKSTKIIEKHFKALSKLIGDNGQVCAVGGDIGFVLFNLSEKEKVVQFLTSADIEFEEDRKVTLSTHTGMNCELDGYINSSEIVSSVHTTMQLSKRSQKPSIIFFDNRLRGEMQKKYSIETIFHKALDNEEFLVFYQPKINLQDYTLYGAEALVRWIHEGQTIYPDDFIPVLENNFTIKDLDMYMLKHICKQLRKWIDEGKQVVQVSVNLSRASLDIPNLVNVIVDIIDLYNLPHSLIQIEVTESAEGANDEQISSLIKGLHEKEISTAMDDFGTGFSSLSLVHELPWDVLKLDKSLLQGAQVEGSREQLMFKSIISMANSIDIKCIVEGVETREDIKILKESECFYAQGYYFDKPLPKEEFEKKL